MLLEIYGEIGSKSIIDSNWYFECDANCFCNHSQIQC